MLVVIFRAHLARLDADYSTTAARLRELAFAEHGCVDFSATTEGDHEIAVSYWPDETTLSAWKRHVEHLQAQERGRAAWYRSYRVDVARVERSYRWPKAP